MALCVGRSLSKDSDVPANSATKGFWVGLSVVDLPPFPVTGSNYMRQKGQGIVAGVFITADDSGSLTFEGGALAGELNDNNSITDSY